MAAVRIGGDERARRKEAGVKRHALAEEVRLEKGGEYGKGRRW